MSYVGEVSLGMSVFLDPDPAHPALRASKCPLCGDVRFPARALCPRDLTEAETLALAGDGTLYETVELSLPPKGFEPPLWVGFVDMDGGARVFSTIRAIEGERPPTSGDRVRLSIGVVGMKDEPVYGPVFERI